MSTSTQEVYKKRAGTTDKGKDYECLMIASLVLRMLLDPLVKNFTLSSNADSFGALDDIVIQVDDGSQPRKYAIQLKHVDNKEKNISSQKLCNPKGNFSIIKYFESFQKEEKGLDGFLLILYTNCKSGLSINETFNISKGIDVKVIHRDLDPLLSTGAGINYQFQIESNMQGTPDMYKTFFKQFYLYTDQFNAQELKNYVRKQLETVCTKEEFFSKYITFLTEWSHQKGKIFKLTKSIMRKAMTLIYLNNFVTPLTFAQHSNENPLREAILKFDVTILRTASTDDVKQIWGDAKNLLQDLSQINQLRKTYQISESNVNNVNDISDIDCSKYLWLMGACPLIILDNPQVYKISSLLDGAVVLLGDNPNTAALEKCSVFSKLEDLEQYPDLYDNITTTFNCLMDDRKISLCELMLRDETIKEEMTPNELLASQSYVISEEKEELPFPYIPRLISRNVIDWKYLETIDQDTLVVISNAKNVDDVELYTKNFQTVNHSSEALVTNSVKHNVLVTAHTNSQSDFHQIYKQNENFPRCHHLKWEDGKLEWMESIGDILDIKKYRLDGHHTEEQHLQDSKLENNVFVITDEPGKGKSMLMRSLKNCYSSYCKTIFFTSSEMSALCNLIHDSESLSEHIENYLLNVKYKDYNNFEKRILRLRLREDKVVYIWDGIDELFKKNLETVVNLIKSLAEGKSIHFITCRTHLTSTLESKLCVLSINISQFSAAEQFFYINERLKPHFCDADITTIISKIEKYFSIVASNDMLGIPIQIYLLTELFIQDSEKYSNLLDTECSIADLYKYFVDEKFNLLYDKQNATNDKFNFLFDSYKRGIIKSYQQAALLTLFEEEFTSQLNLNCQEFLEEIMEQSDRFGFIVQVKNDVKKPEFVHSSYAEFFAATYFVAHHKNIPFLKDFIFDVKHNNIRFFFDMLLAGTSGLHIAILNKNYNVLRQYEGDLELKDLGDRTILHILCSWGERYPLLPSTQKSDIYLLDDKNSSFLHKENTEYELTLLDLLKKLDVATTDDIFNMSCISYAEKGECLYTIALIEQEKKTDHLMHLISSQKYSIPCSLLFYAVQCGYDSVIDLFPPDIKFIQTTSDNTLLHLAIEKYQPKCLQKLLNLKEYQKYINSDIHLGSTPLFLACNYGYSDLVQVLVSFGANDDSLVSVDSSVLIVSENGWTPLHVAAFYGRDKIVNYLIEFKGAEVNAVDKRGFTPLHLASRNGNLTIAKLLINFGATINVSSEDELLTPLLLAARNGHCAVAELLVKSGADKDATTKSGSTSIHLASKEGFANIVELFVSSGCDANVTDKNGSTPMRLAMDNAHHKVIDVLRNQKVCNQRQINITQAASDKFNAATSSANEAAPAESSPSVDDNFTANEEAFTDIQVPNLQAVVEIEQNDKIEKVKKGIWTELHAAAKGGIKKVVQMLIKSGANVNAADQIGHTPLYAASESGHEDVVDLLIKAGAEIDAVSKTGCTPLYITANRGRLKIVQLLLASGANIHLRKIGGFTSLYVAAEYGHKDVVDLLITAGAEIDAAAEDGCTPLYIAANRGHTKVVQLLLASGANIHHRKIGGYTSLYVAAEYGHEDVVELLITAGADINAAEDLGCTPLHVAADRGQQKIVELLLKYKADIKCVNKDGSSALTLACEKGRDNVVQLLINHGATFRIP